MHLTREVRVAPLIGHLSFVCGVVRLNGISLNPTILLVIRTFRSTAMPKYEFVCTACKKSFVTTLPLSEYERGKITCPKCGSRKVNQRVSTFYAVTSKKSA